MRRVLRHAANLRTLKLADSWAGDGILKGTAEAVARAGGLPRLQELSLRFQRTMPPGHGFASLGRAAGTHAGLRVFRVEAILEYCPDSGFMDGAGNDFYDSCEEDENEEGEVESEDEDEDEDGSDDQDSNNESVRGPNRHFHRGIADLVQGQASLMQASGGGAVGAG